MPDEASPGWSLQDVLWRVLLEQSLDILDVLIVEFCLQGPGRIPILTVTDIELKNKNSPRCENVRSRERMKAWRLRNGQGQVDPETGLSMSYMAVRSRIYRQRRKERQAAAQVAAAAHADPNKRNYVRLG
eukprot:COSAG02_NODE_168_length_31711_cov_68.337973_11_plen_130_part_00